MEEGDLPLEIVKAWRRDDEIEFIVNWKPWNEKYTPMQSVVTNKELWKNCPLVLLDFYEKNLVFITNWILINNY